MMRLDERTAIITGAARGIGQAIATRLARDGARVMIADVDKGAADIAAEEIGDRALAQRLDVTEAQSWDAGIRAALDRWGRIDILVNNAGIAGRSAPIWELGLDEWQQLLAIDLTGVFLGCRAVLPTMIKKPAAEASSTSPPSPVKKATPTQRPTPPPRPESLG